MNDVKQLTRELEVIIGDTGTPSVVRAGSITDDIGARYAGLADSHPVFKEIVDMAGKIKASGATEGENGVMWGEIIRLVHNLGNA